MVTALFTSGASHYPCIGDEQKEGASKAATLSNRIGGSLAVSPRSGKDETRASGSVPILVREPHLTARVIGSLDALHHIRSPMHSLLSWAENWCVQDPVSPPPPFPMVLAIPHAKIHGLGHPKPALSPPRQALVQGWDEP